MLKVNNLYSFDSVNYNFQLIKNDVSIECSFIKDSTGNINLYSNNPLSIYDIKNNNVIKRVSYTNLRQGDFKLISHNTFYYGNRKSNEITLYQNGIKTKTIQVDATTYLGFFSQEHKNIFVSENTEDRSFYKFYDNKFIKIANSTKCDRVLGVLKNEYSNSVFAANASNLVQLFSHIKQYPRLFNNTNSNSIFSIQQDNNGTIYAAGYTSGLATFSDNAKLHNSHRKFMFMNGGINIKNHVLFMGEGSQGVVAFASPTKNWKITENVTGFCLFESRDKTLYMGTYRQGLWYCKNPKIEYGKKLIWKKIGIEQGLSLKNVLTITEDNLGNIWMGNSGIAMYNPKTNKAVTWKDEDSEFYFKSMCNTTDTKGTLWFGDRAGGIWYNKIKNKDNLNPTNFKRMQHPLLQKGSKVTFLHQWKDFLVIGASDKVLFFNLKKWYADNTVLVKYLNPLEANFSAPTEQNTVLTDNKNQSLWFATSDNLYNLDVKKWLTLPQFKVLPSIIINNGTVNTTYKPGQCIHFKANENHFKLEITYQSKDNLPRYINGVLANNDEKVLYENPNLQTDYSFMNLAAGNYVFYIRVCQQDGSFETFKYPIIIDSYLWQKWWFWALLFLIPISFMFYYFKTKAAIEKTKKRLTQLNLASLSNQFRPHFMLNVLNSIGSQMENMPHAEKVISRLGESINILYGFTQNNQFVHSYNNEWQLVKNIIEIQNLLFIPDLNVTIINTDGIPNAYKIPIGLLQIPVENALLHGLRNIENGSKNLTIKFTEIENYYLIEITDNGIGRAKAKGNNNFKNNGKGLQTLYNMIGIVNKQLSKSIYFEISDLANNCGTSVIIKLKKNIDYDKIKL